MICQDDIPTRLLCEEEVGVVDPKSDRVAALPNVSIA